MIAFLAGALGGLITGVLGAFATDFLRTPFRRFFDLRSEVRQQMHVFGNVRAKYKTLRRALEVDDEERIEEVELSAEDEARLKQAQEAFRLLGSRMRAFAETETLVVSALKRLGFDPSKAGDGLIGLSNSINTYGKTRAFQTQTIEKALKFKAG